METPTRPWTHGEIAELCAEARVRGFTKGDLAAKLGIHPSTLSDWLKPQRARDLTLLQRNALSWVDYQIRHTTKGRKRQGRGLDSPRSGRVIAW